MHATRSPFTSRLRAGALTAALTLITAFGAAACGGATSSDEPDASPADDADERAELLFVQSADSGSLETVQGQLTLEGALPTVEFFSDRPARIAGQMSAATLAEDWDDLFGDDPPNAAVQHLGGPYGSQPAVLELLGPPRYEGNRTLTYDVALVDPPENVPAELELHGVSLFIDGGIAGADDFSSGAIGTSCNWGDTHNCVAFSARTGSSTAPQGCTEWDPRCKKDIAASDCDIADPRCKKDTVAPGCNISDPYCPTVAVGSSCDPFIDPRC